MSATLNDIPLSDEQRNAILNPAKLVAVGAGPGTGKTHTAAAKVVAIAEQGIDPSRIIAVSFTRFAADEMDLRLRRLLGGRFVQAIGLGTFHGLARKIIRLDPGVLGLGDDFGVLSPKEGFAVIKSQLAEPVNRDLAEKVDRDADEQARQVNERIGLSYHRCESIEQLYLDGALGQLAANCRIALEDHQQFNNVLALDRWIPAAAQVMADPSVAELVHSRWTQVLVDEFQDSNPAQMLLLRRLVGPNTRLWVVGDEDQAIYGFRGSVPGALREITSQPDAHLAALTINRRCAAPILDAANRLIAHNARPERSPLRAAPGNAGGQIGWTEFESDFQEGGTVARRLRAANEQGVPYREMLVVAPSHKLLDGLHEDLIGNGVPYTPSDGVQLSGRRHVAPAVHAIRLVVGMQVTFEQMTACLTALQHVGEKRAAAILDHCRQSSQPPLEADLSMVDGLDARARSSVLRWQQDLNRLRRSTGPTTPIGGVVDQILDAPWGLVALQRRLAEEGSDRQAQEAHRSLRDIESFRGATHRLARTGDVRTLSELVAHLDRQQLIDGGNGEDRVTLTTIHGAKGTEADVVFALGFEEGALPSRHSSTTPQQIDEQRRCAYVAMTRARTYCRVTNAASRNGQIRRPSRFISEAGLRRA